MLTSSDKIKHLYWRAGFGLSLEELKNIKGQSLDSTVHSLFKKAKEVKKVSSEYQNKSQLEFKKLSDEERKEVLKKEKQLILRQNADWVARMANPKESALLEKMSLFWHGHFACTSKSSKLAYQQLNTIRKHALGNFRSFVHAMARDVSMIRFLNNQQNRKKQPNENFARELMELFTIGRGNYTEQDIKEAARAFTGWSSDFKNEYKFKKHQHDFGQKTFMGKEGTFNGDDIINIILDRKETAYFICRKIYRFFVNDKLNEKQVKLLAERFYQTDYDIKDLMLTIFKSDWFYAPENIGVKIKSPVELMAGIMRTLNVEFDGTLPVAFIERALCQVLFDPPNVAGWAGGKSWIDNSTLMLRLNLVGYLFLATDVHFKVKGDFEMKKRNKAVRKIKATVNLKPLISNWSKKENKQIFNELSHLLIQPALKSNYESVSPFLVKSNKEDFIKSSLLRLMSLPEYQLC